MSDGGYGEGMRMGIGLNTLFIADSTRRALRRPVHGLSLVGDLQVRGRERKIRVWSLRPGPARDGRPRSRTPTVSTAA